MIVENAAGAAGITGSARAARSAPDGYTLLMGPMSTMSFSPTFYPNAPVHTLKDFEPVGIVASAPIVIVGSKEIPGDTLKEFVASAKKKAKLSNGNAGVGTTSHLACVMLNARFGVDPAIVPYKSSGAAVADMLTGTIDYVCDQSTSVMGQVSAGAIKALAVLAPTPSPALPGVPTIAQAGYPGRRDGGVERAVCAQGHAARDHHADQRRDRQGHHRPGRARALREARRRAAAARRPLARGARPRSTPPTSRNGAR